MGRIPIVDGGLPFNSTSRYVNLCEGRGKEDNEVVFFSRIGWNVRLTVNPYLSRIDGHGVKRIAGNRDSEHEYGEIQMSRGTESKEKLALDQLHRVWYLMVETGTIGRGCRATQSPKHCVVENKKTKWMKKTKKTKKTKKKKKK
uniref:Uncharacterized protein n=1 Tax=Vespula pensylvanica TaxID=30213 RepID=A0A834KJ53_VESPE|nr:hypothetical protein H0235_014543 [Vespula pensylvanica]